MIHIDYRSDMPVRRRLTSSSVSARRVSAALVGLLALVLSSCTVEDRPAAPQIVTTIADTYQASIDPATHDWPVELHALVTYYEPVFEFMLIKEIGRASCRESREER